VTTRAQRFLVVGAIALMLAFGYFVWPTPYQYIPVAPGARYPTSGEGFTIVSVRINRFTGRTYLLLPEAGWIQGSK
jgi:hypothetical protein